MEEQKKESLWERAKKNPQELKKLIIGLILFISFAVIYETTKKSGGSSSGSGSSSSVTHTCLNCGKSYSGYGYATIGGEEYALDKDQGNQYCSKSCAKASRTGKFKNM